VKQLLTDIAQDTHLDKIYAIGETEDYPDLLVQSDQSKNAYLFDAKNDFRRIQKNGTLSYGNYNDVNQVCKKNWTSNSFPIRGTGKSVWNGRSTVWQFDHVKVNKSIVKALIGTFPSYEEAAWNRLVLDFGSNLIWAGHGIIPPSLVTPLDKACQDKTLLRLKQDLKKFLIDNEK
jgi:hypothetical protein